MTDYKSRVKKSLDKYYESLLVDTTPKRKNKSPEKTVEAEVLQWCRTQGWFVCVVESKSAYSKSANRFLQGPTRKGFPDVVGCTSSGLFVAIELKAPGRRASLRFEQREFLHRAITLGAFGVVVDSSEVLANYYQAFLKSPRPETLMDLLPKQKVKPQDTLLFT